MIIKRIKLHNFKNFKDGEYFFESMTFIKGKNGSGKTTLALESILFALYGYTPKDKLQDLPTRNISKSCSVEIEIIKKDKNYIIKRNYPTKLSIKEEDKELEFTTSRDAQNFIDKTFGDRLNFMKFRCIDAYTKETNFLDEGQTTLKKIMFSHSDEVFNNIRNKLNEIKHEREIYNKDNAIISPHCPSELRLETLEIGQSEVESELVRLNRNLEPLEREYMQLSNQKARNSSDLRACYNQKKQIQENKSCYACKRGLSEDQQKLMIEEVNNKIDELEISVQNLNKKETAINTQRIEAKTQSQTLLKRIYEIKSLISKLETRIKQKEFKYTNKDVLIVKKAIEELDKLSTYYLIESIKILEPIINNILMKIGFEVKFAIDKGKFAITLQKDGIIYKYKDLSTGQKLILQIAFKLALLLDRNEEGLLVADEGMSSLDKENLNHILSIFQSLPFQLLFVIHNLDEIPENIKIIDLNKEK